MGLKLIKGRSYYYEVVRDGRRVRTRYVGAGEFGRLLARADQIVRARREAARAAGRLRLRALAEEDREQARYHRGVDLLFRLALEDAGYHRHDRGAWRKRRMGQGKQGRAGTATTAAPPAPVAPRSYTRAEVQAVADKAQEGDAAAAEEFKATLKSDQWRGPLLRTIGEAAQHLNRKLIAGLARPDGLALQDALEERAEVLHRELLPPDPHPLERLLVARVVTCWLETNVTGYRATCDGDSPAVCEALQRRADRAHRRLLSAIRALRDFRRLDVRVSLHVGDPARPEPPGGTTRTDIPSIEM